MNIKPICDTCYNKSICKYSDEVSSVEEKVNAIKADADKIICDAVVINVSMTCRHRVPGNASFTYPRS